MKTFRFNINDYELNGRDGEFQYVFVRAKSLKQAMQQTRQELDKIARCRFAVWHISSISYQSFFRWQKDRFISLEKYLETR